MQDLVAAVKTQREAARDAQFVVGKQGQAIFPRVADVMRALDRDADRAKGLAEIEPRHQCLVPLRFLGLAVNGDVVVDETVDAGSPLQGQFMFGGLAVREDVVFDARRDPHVQLLVVKAAA